LIVWLRCSWRIGRLRLGVWIVAVALLFRSLLHCEAEGAGGLSCRRRCGLGWIVRGRMRIPAHGQIRSAAAAEGVIVIMIGDERRC
jgi:hypothetical protein